MAKQLTPYVPQAPQLARGIEHICYEYANLMAAAYWTMHGAAPWRTHADDAFLLGYRKLADFLLYTHRSQRQGKELPDILARDYLSTRAKAKWTLPTWKKERAVAMDKQLAHLSYERDKAWVHYQWVPILEKEFRQAWAQFRRSVATKYKKAFAAEIAKCRKKHGFRAIKL
jgi:hypothetical protein